MAVLDVRVMESAGQGPSARYVYELRSSDVEGTGPLEQEYSADVSPTLVQRLCGKIDELVQGAGERSDDMEPVAELARFGGLLYHTLFPRAHGSIPDLVTRLGQPNGPLLVRTNESLIPWELLHDGEEFLALKHDLGRRSFVDRRVVGGRTIGTIGRALVIGDPMGDLASARREAEDLAAWLRKRRTECMVFLGAEASLLEVVAELASGRYDLLHYSGHVAVPFGTVDAGLLLHERELLDERALAPLSNVGVPPIVFINGCASADRLANLCVSFMVMGAKVVVGTRYEIGETGPRRFAERFYAELMEETPAGAAVRAARQSLRRASDLDWTSFVLYGDPTVRVLPGAQRPPELPPEPPQGLEDVERGLDGEAKALLGRVVRRAAPRGVVTSMDLLTELLSTRDLRRRMLDAVGAERLALVDELLHGLLDRAPHGDGGKIGVSDTVQSVLSQAGRGAAAAGRDLATVDDLVTAFVEVGGGSSARVLELFGIPLAQLREADAAGDLDPAADGRGRPARHRSSGPSEPYSGLFDGSGRLQEARLDPDVAAALRMAALLAAAQGTVISTGALLHGLAMTGGQVLGASLREQGPAGTSAFRRLSSAVRADRSSFSPRTRRALERAAAAAPVLDEAALLRELLSEADASARGMLSQLGVDPDRLSRALPRDDRGTSP